MKRWNRGLVVGKFFPPHKGHQHLIETAARQVDVLVVLVYSNPDAARFDSSTRAGLIERIYGPKIGRTSLIVRSIPAPEVPHNGTGDFAQRDFVKGYMIDSGLPYPEVVFTSEDYGEGFGGHLGVAHVMVDRNRLTFPTSGTEVCSNLYEHLDMLPLVVRDYYTNPCGPYIERVVFVGAESTGKSTLTRRMAKYYGTQYVPEYGDLLFQAKKGKLVFEDMLEIAEVHRRLEDEIAECRHYLFVDTNAITTEYFSYAMFGRCDKRLKKYTEDCRRRYPHVFVCEPDFPYDSSNGRMGQALQKVHQGMVKMQLDYYGIHYSEVGGTVEERVEQVRHVLDEQKQFNYFLPERSATTDRGGQ